MRARAKKKGKESKRIVTESGQLQFEARLPQKLASLRSAGSRSVPFGRRGRPPREEGDGACVAGRRRNPAAARGEEEPGVGGAGASRASGRTRAERIGGIFPTAPRLDACRFSFHAETPRGEESRAGQVGRGRVRPPFLP
jgi:hypothetical protein